MTTLRESTHLLSLSPPVDPSHWVPVVLPALNSKLIPTLQFPSADCTSDRSELWPSGSSAARHTGDQ